MQHNKTSVCLMALAASASLQAGAATVYFKADFQTGAIPKSMTAADLDGMAVSTQAYRRGNTDKGWKVEQAGTHGYAAVSPTYAGAANEGNAQLNVLAGPQFTVASPTAFVRWEARAMLPGRAEAYRVVAVEPDGTETELFATDSEEDWWTERALPLAAFEGKEIRLEWRAVSTNGYMLAVDNIWAGEDEGTLRFATADATRRLQAHGNVTACGTLTNTGASCNPDALLVHCGGTECGRIALTGEWAPGETREWQFELPSSLNDATEYTLSLQTGDEIVPVHNGRVWASHFERTRLLDVGTGMWCPNCPDGHLEVEQLQREWPGQIIAVEAHANPDVLEVPEYWRRLNFYAAPYYMLDRDPDTKTGNRGRTAQYMEGPTTAHIAVEALEANEDGSYTLRTAVQTTETLDNNSGRYRVGYIPLREVDETTGETFAIYQDNGQATQLSEQYWFLPAKILSPMVKMHNVVCGWETAFTGVPNSLAAYMKPSETYCSEVAINLPDAITDPSRARLAVLLLDSATGEVMNAALAELGDAGASVGANVASQSGKVTVSNGNLTVIPADASAPWTLTLTDTAGRKLMQASGTGTETIPTPAKGMAIATLQQKGSHYATKIIL